MQKGNAQCRKAGPDINVRAHKTLFSETMGCPEFWRVPWRIRNTAMGTYNNIYLDVE